LLELPIGHGGLLSAATAGCACCLSPSTWPVEILIWRGLTCWPSGCERSGCRPQRLPCLVRLQAFGQGERPHKLPSADLLEHEALAVRVIIRVCRRRSQGVALDRDVDFLGLHARQDGLDHDVVAAREDVHGTICRRRTATSRMTKLSSKSLSIAWRSEEEVPKAAALISVIVHSTLGYPPSPVGSDALAAQSAALRPIDCRPGDHRTLPIPLSRVLRNRQPERSGLGELSALLDIARLASASEWWLYVAPLPWKRLPHVQSAA